MQEGEWSLIHSIDINLKTEVKSGLQPFIHEQQIFLTSLCEQPVKVQGWKSPSD